MKPRITTLAPNAEKPEAPKQKDSYGTSRCDEYTPMRSLTCIDLSRVKTSLSPSLSVFPRMYI